MASLRSSSTTNAALGLAAVGVGVIAGAQVARMTIFPDAMGKSRAPWINYIAGVAGAAAIISGRARTQETMGAACFGVGMALAQVGLKSFSEWDLVPGDTFGA
jgi:hypothetical protein